MNILYTGYASHSNTQIKIEFVLNAYLNFTLTHSGDSHFHWENIEMDQNLHTNLFGKIKISVHPSPLRNKWKVFYQNSGVIVAFWFYAEGPMY